MPTERLSAAAARRIAIAAQGLAEPRPGGRVDRRHLRRVLDRVGLVQIDSVNVVARSQELVLFARLGPHPRSLIPDATAAGELFEYWGHEASHIPSRDHRLYRWKMQAARDGAAWPGVLTMQRERPHYVEDVYRRVADGGPVMAGELSERVGPKGPWWDWDHAKLALEYLFWVGRLTATRRSGDFARVYDLPERVVPAQHLDAPTPDEHAARKELLVRAAASLGVGTDADLADYHRQKVTRCRALLGELVAEGRLLPVSVEGWSSPAYAHPDARVPRRVDGARALLSPFDPLVWYRARAERLFDFHYRIELYTPRPKRRFGYYVMPFLLGESIVARVDVKADRAGGALVVPGAFTEAHADPAAVAGPLAEELSQMAAWLGLGRVAVGDAGDNGDNGDLCAPLRAALRGAR
ncbi:MAG: YcaQ family DNA glycosylase [Actinomycetota bacterium]|nr:MAG: YcaQ family DNA glycosylase [Actinomycetota bacterium]